MLLTIDIGNTNIVIALFKDDVILSTWRLFTDTRRTGDEYETMLTSLLKDYDIDMKGIDYCVISSVVPALIGAFVGLMEKKLLGRISSFK